MTADPYLWWRNTALWRTIAQALLRLQADGYLKFGEETDSRAIAIGELCASLDFDEHAIGTRLAAVRASFKAAGPDFLIADIQDMRWLPFNVCTLIGNGHGEQDIAKHIAKSESEIAAIEERPMHEFLQFARALIQAYETGARE